MAALQKEFEKTGNASWISSDIYPDGKIYTREYTEWLEKQVLELRVYIVDIVKIIANNETLFDE